MESVDRLVGHALLPVAELLALPVSIVATAVVLFVGTIALQAARFVGALVAVGSDAIHSTAGVSLPVITAWNDFVHATIVFATVVALVSAGALVVELYRRVFETFENPQPETVILVPLLGVSPAVYALVSTGSVSLPWWAFAFTALWAHALAYRVIAIEGILDEDRPASLLVASGVAIPAVGAHVLLVADGVGPTGVLSVPGHAGVLELTRATFLTVSAIVPLDRSLLFVVPLGVTLCYGLRRVYRERESLAGVRRSLKRPSYGVRSLGSSTSSGGSEPSEPWIPTSPSPGSGPRRRADRNVTDSGADDIDGSNDSGDEDPSSTRDGTSSDDGPSADHHFPNTQIFTGDFDAARSSGPINESCPNCGGTIDASNEVEFCPHCGADR